MMPNASNTNTDAQDMQTLLALLAKHQISLPAERLGLILEEQQLIREHIALVNRQGNRSQRSHITTQTQPRKTARPPIVPSATSARPCTVDKRQRRRCPARR